MTATLAPAGGHPFLAGLPPGWIDRLAGTGRWVDYPANHRIIREGGPADRFWLIQHGRIRLDMDVPGRGELCLGTLGPGAVLGCSWLFPPYRWTFGAVTAAATGAWEFDAAAVTRLCDEDPEFGFVLLHRFVGVLVDRLRVTRLRLLDLYAYPGVPRIHLAGRVPVGSPEVQG